MDQCIFCDIANKKAPAYIVWEDDEFIAFLSIFPNTEGVTVVIPKQHYDSYIFSVPENIMHGLVQRAKVVAHQLDNAFDDVGRTGLIFEGFGVNHLHAKLFPMHGTKSSTWKRHSSSNNAYFEMYQGYLSSHDAERVDNNALKKTLGKILMQKK